MKTCLMKVEGAVGTVPFDSIAPSLWSGIHQSDGRIRVIKYHLTNTNSRQLSGLCMD